VAEAGRNSGARKSSSSSQMVRESGDWSMDVQLLGGTGEVEFFCHGEEATKVAQFHSSPRLLHIVQKSAYKASSKTALFAFGTASAAKAGMFIPSARTVCTSSMPMKLRICRR
jgi:hypothetical protein